MFIALIVISGILLILSVKNKEMQKKLVDKFSSDKTENNMKLLFSEKESRTQIRKYTEKKIRVFLLIIFLGSVFSQAYRMTEKINPVIDTENKIIRDDYGGSDKQLDIFVDSEKLTESEKINITVSKRRYSADEINNKSRELIEILNTTFLGENISADHIETDLYMPNQVKGYPFKINWKSDNPLILDNYGSINRDRLEKELEKTGSESALVKIMVTLSYDDFSMQQDFAVNIFNHAKTAEAVFIENIQDEIALENESSKQNESLILPKIVEGHTVKYSSEDKVTPIIILILSILSAFLVYSSFDRDLDKKADERNKQMEFDYPKIINRYALYYSAGMHTKSIWKEICSDYRKNLAATGERRYIFDEMLRAEAAMADGKGEVSAYNQFASNCRIRKYRRFITLIEQSLQKGKNQMEEALRKEVDDAINERLAMAKIRGEEAGTKLLLPMFLMLLVVLIIVIVPAFINFRV